MLQEPQPLKTNKHCFTVDAEDLRKIARLTNVPQRSAPLGLVEIAPPYLHYTRLTAEGSFTSTAKIEVNDCHIKAACELSVSTAQVEVRDWPDNESVQFQLDAVTVSKIGSVWQGALNFEYDQEDLCLSWSQPAAEDCKIQLTVLSGKPRHVAEITSNPVIVSAANLHEAISKPSIFVARPDKLNERHAGIEIENGLARGGYSRGFVGYRSQTLPEAMQVVIPKRNAGNVTTTLAKISGEMELRTTESTICLTSPTIELSWSKDQYRAPRFFKAALDQETITSFTISTGEFSRAVMALSIGIEHVALRPETKDDISRLVLTGYGDTPSGVPSGTRITAKAKTPLTEWMRTEELPSIWPFSINVKDLLDAVLAVKTDRLELATVKTGILVRAEASSYAMAAYLHGFQPA